ncbi:MAG TPA: TIGR00730 family Rossman fold protein [Vicinamibacteria bacterium]
MKRVCVFCGSRMGRDPRYRDAATAVGRSLVRRGLGLVYGGGGIGLMSVVADAVLEGGGSVVGIIPHGLAAREVAHRGVTEMRVVPSMHARKALMAEMSDAFVALPGGFGTFEELFESVTWAQLGIHAKPLGLLNVAGYFDHLVKLVDKSVEEGFVPEVGRDLMVVDDEPESLLDRLAAYEAPAGPAWLVASDV